MPSTLPEKKRWRERSPWEGRQAVTTGELLWGAHEWLSNAVVYAHYRIRRHERGMRPMDAYLWNQVLKFSKGLVTSFETWLRVAHPRSSSVPSSEAQPHDSSPRDGADHADAASSPRAAVR